MKKIIALLMCAVLVFSLAACSTSQGVSTKDEATTVATKSEAAPTDMNVFTLKGPTGMGMTKLMSDSDSKTAANNYSFTLASAADEIVAAISSKDADVAACPVNLASTLYKKTGGEVEILAVNTLGVLYLLSSDDSIKSVKDLKGKTIDASGQSATPEYVLDMLLKSNGLDPDKDVTVNWETEHSQTAALAISKEADTVLLPEPFVTTVLSQNKDMKIALDLTKEWKSVSDTDLAMGCIIARKDYIKANKAAIDTFLAEYKASVDYVNNNQESAAQLIEKYGIVAKAALAQKAITNCNMVCITDEQMKEMVEDNLSVLYDANPSSVGGKMPDESFYYSRD